MYTIFRFGNMKSIMVIILIICSLRPIAHSQDVQENMPLADRLDYVFERNCAANNFVGVA